MFGTAMYGLVEIIVFSQIEFSVCDGMRFNNSGKCNK